MAPDTLAATSISRACDFYYRARIFETLHFPFFLALLALSIQRASIGRLDYPLQEVLIGLAVHIYPMMHHCITRRRIAILL